MVLLSRRDGTASQWRGADAIDGQLMAQACWVALLAGLKLLYVRTPFVDSKRCGACRDGPELRRECCACRDGTGLRGECCVCGWEMTSACVCVCVCEYGGEQVWAAGDGGYTTAHEAAQQAPGRGTPECCFARADVRGLGFKERIGRCASWTCRRRKGGRAEGRKVGRQRCKRKITLVLGSVFWHARRSHSVWPLRRVFFLSSWGSCLRFGRERGVWAPAVGDSAAKYPNSEVSSATASAGGSSRRRAEGGAHGE